MAKFHECTRNRKATHFLINGSNGVVVVLAMVVNKKIRSICRCIITHTNVRTFSNNCYVPIGIVAVLFWYGYYDFRHTIHSYSYTLHTYHRKPKIQKWVRGTWSTIGSKAKKKLQNNCGQSCSFIARILQYHHNCVCVDVSNERELFSLSLKARILHGACNFRSICYNNAFPLSLPYTHPHTHIHMHILIFACHTLFAILIQILLFHICASQRNTETTTPDSKFM